MDDKTLVERVIAWLNGGCSSWGVPVSDIKQMVKNNQAMQSHIEALEAALRDAPAALNAMAAQVEAELRDHDKAAARHDLVVQTFRKKVRDALESKP